MRTIRRLRVIVGAAMLIALFAITSPAKAQEPHYLRALSQLRAARDYIQYDKGQAYGDVRQHAIDEINKAIDEVKHAAWDDGKNTMFQPPMPGSSQTWTPLHNANSWLQTAKGNVSQGVDNPQNAGLREQATRHIDEAQRTLVHLMEMGFK